MVSICEFFECEQSKKRRLDFILDTVSAKHSVGPTLELLKVNGTLVIVGAPDKPIDLPSFPLIFGTSYISYIIYEIIFKFMF